MQSIGWGVGVKEKAKGRFNMSTIGAVLLILALVYLGLGLGFPFMWRSTLTACSEERTAQGEFVELAVFDNVIGLVFDITYWPVYSWANIYHDGTPFATPCTH